MPLSSIVIICITVIIIVNSYLEYKLKHDCIHKDNGVCPLGKKCVCKDVEDVDNPNNI